MLLRFALIKTPLKKTEFLGRLRRQLKQLRPYIENQEGKH